MNIKKTFRYPTALTIAGSDSGGGAGIQADIKTFSALGVFGTSAITSVTAQNTQEVRGIHAVSPEILQGQIEAVFDDFYIDAVKIGMLHNQEAVRIVATSLRAFSPPFVILDPVMISTSGALLLDNDAISKMIEELFPLATLLTPNLDEAKYLTGITIQGELDMERAARKLQELGCHSVLMKGGHLRSQEMTDLLVYGNEAPIRLTTPAIQTDNSHGTGCTLSSAITAYLALRHELTEAVRLGKQYVTSALSAGSDVKTGHGHGPLNHFFSPVPSIKIKKMKKLIVITTPYFFEDEGLIITQLFKEGLEHLHIRKPGCTAADLTSLIRTIPSKYYSRITLHDQFIVATELNLGGIHLNMRNPIVPDEFKGSISRSCHNLQEVKQYRHLDYVFLGPIFDSISKKGHVHAFSMEKLATASSQGIINEKVFALGGIDATTLPLLKDLPFGGVAILGALWGEYGALNNFDIIIKLFKQIQHVL